MKICEKCQMEGKESPECSDGYIIHFSDFDTVVCEDCWKEVMLTAPLETLELFASLVDNYYLSKDLKN